MGASLLQSSLHLLPLRPGVISQRLCLFSFIERFRGKWPVLHLVAIPVAEFPLFHTRPAT